MAPTEKSYHGNGIVLFYSAIKAINCYFYFLSNLCHASDLASFPSTTLTLGTKHSDSPDGTTLGAIAYDDLTRHPPGTSIARNVRATFFDDHRARI